MRKVLLRAFIVAGVGLTSCESLQVLESIGTGVGNPALSNEEVINGLRQALELGAGKAANLASAEDGFFINPLLYIAFPEEAQKVKQTALDLGLSSQVQQFELTLNRAAERASREAAPIFIEAIKGMSIEDGFRILRGSDNEATLYLREKTADQLRQKFRPEVSKAIEAVNLTSYWDPLASAYNTSVLFTGGQSVNPDLTAYVTDKAIDGLFVHIAAEEKNIRENPQARVTELLQRVFGSGL